MTGKRHKRRYIHLTMPMVARMRALRAAGLGSEAIAAVIELDYDGQRPSRPTVDKYAPTSLREVRRCNSSNSGPSQNFAKAAA